MARRDQQKGRNHERKIHERYEWLHIINDLLIGLYFLIGKYFLFLSNNTKDRHLAICSGKRADAHRPPDPHPQQAARPNHPKRGHPLGWACHPDLSKLNSSKNPNSRSEVARHEFLDQIRVLLSEPGRLGVVAR